MVVKFKNTKLYLYKYSKRLVKLLKIELGRNRVRKYINSKTGKDRIISSPINSERSLSDSISVKLDETSSDFSFSISGNSYARNVNDGRKAGTSPPLYQIVNWIKRKPVLLRDSEGKFIKRDDIQITKIAKLISRSIKLNGIRPTSFMDTAIKESIGDLDKLDEPMVQDILMNVEDILLSAGYIKKGENYTIKTE